MAPKLSREECSDKALQKTLESCARKGTPLYTKNARLEIRFAVRLKTEKAYAWKKRDAEKPLQKIYIYDIMIIVLAVFAHYVAGKVK